jgi:hypothetical protein
VDRKAVQTVKAWWGVVGAGAVSVAMCIPMGVEASRPAEQLGLARICVSEAGWDRGPDCPAILEVLRDRSRKMRITLLGAMRAYSGRTFDRARTDARRWIADLQWHAGRPEGWPRNANWEGRYRNSWQDMLLYAGQLLGSDDHPCKADPHHWAAPHFRRPFDLGWERVDCGETANAFWRVK